VDKWVTLCCTVVADHVVVMDVFEFKDKSFYAKTDSEQRHSFSLTCLYKLPNLIGN